MSEKRKPTQRKTLLCDKRVFLAKMERTSKSEKEKFDFSSEKKESTQKS